jgi:hypothetical protein
MLLPGREIYFEVPRSDRSGSLVLTWVLQVKGDSYVLLVPRALTQVRLSSS